MSNILNLKGVKLFAIIVLAVAILATFGIVAVQKARADCSITMTLKVGSHGAEVMCLQSGLGLTSDGSFGPMTKAAVMSWQSSHGLTADGVFGAMSRAAWMSSMSSGGGSMSGGSYPAGCSSASGYSSTTGAKCDGSSSGSYPAGCSSASGYSTTTGMSCSASSTFPAGCSSASGYSSTTGAKCDGSSTSTTSSGPLTGGAGDINAISLLGTPNAEAVGEGEDEHQVLGFEVEADNGSDIALTSAKIEFDETYLVDGGSTHINDYISGVSIWTGTTKVGSASIDDFTKSATGVYSKSVTLSNAVVKADKKVRFYVAVDGNNTVDSDDMVDQIGVEVTSVRFTDATGAILTNTPTPGDIQQYFTIESEADASGAKLVLTESSSNPNAGVVEVDDDTETTDGVVLLKGKLKAEGSALWIDEIPVLFTVTGAANVDDVTNSVTLAINGQDFSETMTATAGSTETITFDDLDLTLDAGDSFDFTVSADVNGVGSALDSGDSLKADVTSTERDLITVAVGDENGDDLGTSSSDRTGSATGEAQGFYNQGINVTPGATTAEFNAGGSGGGDSYGTFEVKFSVTAIGVDIFLDKTVLASSSTSATPSAGNRVLVLESDGVTNVFSSGTLTATDSNSTEGTETFEVQNGQTAKFTLSVASSADPNAFIRAVIYGLMWGDGDTATGDSVYNLDMGVDGSYKTGTVFVND